MIDMGLGVVAGVWMETALNPRFLCGRSIAGFFLGVPALMLGKIWSYNGDFEIAAFFVGLAFGTPIGRGLPERII